MKRAAAIIVTCAIVVGAFVLISSDKETGRVYEIELDNAFGLDKGGDVMVAGVRAGQIESFDVTDNKKALVKVRLGQGYDSLRSDAFCQTRPQSEIGEYF